MNRYMKKEEKHTLKMLYKAAFIVLAAAVFFGCKNPWMEKIINVKTITFNSNGGSRVKSQDVRKGSKIKEPSDPVKSGFLFGGWYEDNQTFESPWDFDTAIREDMTLYAKWAEGGEVPADIIISAAITVTGPATDEAPVTTASGTGNFTIGTVSWTPTANQFQPSTVYTATVTLTAHQGYTFASTVTATINGNTAKVDGNTGGTLTLSYTFAATSAGAVTGIVVTRQPEKLTYTHGETLNLTGLVVTLTYDDGTAEVVELAGFGPKGITTVPAHGAALSRSSHNDNPVTVTYSGKTADTNNLTVAKADPTVTWPTGASITYGKTLADAVFTGHSGDGTFAFVESTAVPVVADSGTLYEVTFTPTDTANYNTLTQNVSVTVNCTVTFNTNGGSAVSPQTVAGGGTASRPEDPTRSGYIFDGWYTDDGTLWDFDTIPANSMTLYAKWNVTVTITFDANGGSPVPSNQTVVEGSLITRPSNPEKSDYTFEGWYTDSDVLWDFNVSPTSDMTLTAKWAVFGGDVPDANIFDVANSDEWDDAVTTINSGSGNYMINIRANFNLDGVTFNTFSAQNITVYINGNGNTINLNGQGNLLRIGSGQTVYMLGLTLRGSTANNTSLVYIDGGTFTMESGAITGNIANYSGSGVFVKGSFTMNGGEVSGNTTTEGGYGGGVYVSSDSGSFFTMNGGKVSGNTSTDYGGGVFSARTFTMNGGEVSNNTAANDGGGVGVYGSFFNMNGGEVSDNTAGRGGGVYLFSGGGFTMTGGYVSRNTAATDGGGVYINTQGDSFRISNGTVYGNNGESNSNKAQNGAALYDDKGIAVYGSGNTRIPLDDSSASTGGRNATIRVVNGDLQ